MSVRTPTDDEIAYFRAHDYVIVPGFLDPATCARERARILEIRDRGGMKNVDQKGVTTTKRFFTINGPRVDEQLPQVTALYQELNAVVDRLAGEPFTPLDNRDIGLSINVVPRGGQFSFHYDRNEITGVIFLNDVPGGELEMYPRYRFHLPRSNGRIGKRAQQALDLMLRPAAVRAVAGKRVVVPPSAGTLVVMVASRCLHRVHPPLAEEDRVTLVLSFDRPGVTFPRELTTDYYGY